MATKQYEINLILVLLALTLYNRGATAQSSTCSNTMMSLSSCLNYVTGNSSAPSPSCCSSLANVVQSQPQCLCPLLNGSGGGAGSSLGNIAINQTLAMALPALCNVQTPPLSQCNAVGSGPAGAPAPSTSSLDSPTDASTEPEQGQTIPSAPGSKIVPNSGSTSDGSPKTLSIYLTIFGLLVFAWNAKIFNC